MAAFKNTLIPCQKCGKSIAVRVRDFENGSIRCTHAGCGHVNQLVHSFYDDRVLQGLPGFGQLIYQGTPAARYPLRIGINVVGTAPTSDIAVERYVHEGKCYISRRHCTIEVLFNQWTGSFRYQLQDGASDVDSRHYKNSLNGTQLNGYLLQNGEKIDMGNGGKLSLGGKDVFFLETYCIPDTMLATYLTVKPIEPDETQ